ncbi:ribonuclease H-like domain-containing protein [Tanacetum coccineum]
MRLSLQSPRDQDLIYRTQKISGNHRINDIRCKDITRLMEKEYKYKVWICQILQEISQKRTREWMSDQEAKEIEAKAREIMPQPSTKSTAASTIEVSNDPRKPHFLALKRVSKYIRGTLDYGLQLFSSSITDLVAYSDADWAGCLTTRRSTSGYCVFFGNNLLSWSSKSQPTLSHSSAEAEYRGVANDVAETCWLMNLLRELHTPLSFAMLVYYNNASAVYLSSNPVQHQRTKHIEIDIHFVRDLVAAGQVRVLHVHSRYQYAYIFTKGLPSTLFEEFRTSLSVRCPPAPTAGEC